MKRARIASLPAAAADLLDGERRAIVEWPSTPGISPPGVNGNVAGCVISATRASDGTPMLDVMDCDPAMRVRVVWDNLARMSISDAMCDRALAAMGYRPAYPNEHARDAQRKTMRAAIEAAIYGEAQGLPAAHALAAAGEIVDNAPVVYRCVCGHFKEEHTVEGGCAGCDNGGVASDAEIMHTYRADRGAPVYASELRTPQPEPEDVTYVCACSWLGGDPDEHRGKHPTCPACWAHDKRRVPVAKVSHDDDASQTRETLKLLTKYRGKRVRRGGTAQSTIIYAVPRTTLSVPAASRRLAVCASQAIADNCVAAFNAKAEWSKRK